ncbi:MULTISPECIES: ABC transporter ATP-binding protein [Paenibacillus]|uniref:Nickel import system ATP-binding protein NikD n=1 Tax=Paenibacillus violae TaxID=3077234 RepID=A0ABU3RMD7_9BACL|nr:MULTISPECIES: ABC transporter ATP-binding protein [Paenibacillus]MDU0205423.1 ABC transporter ATP-binding protein [Paenibacillus sp. PFR10]MEC0268587.1 ABC transporter ATP-binding protein [Paenibacillus anseongense]
MLEVSELSISFNTLDRHLRPKKMEAIHKLELSIDAGEILAVVGSSGSGKSLLAHAILGILPGNAQVTGTIRFKGEKLTAERQEGLRGKEIALIPQSVQYLDPLMRVGDQVRQAVRRGNPAELQRKAFSKYKLSDFVAKLFPFQLSGGMARKVLVSTATVSGAQLLIADEPTPGLDAPSMSETLSRFKQLAQEGCAVMLITHDIEAALTVADRIAVLYAGTVVEIAPRTDFTGDGQRLRHPYTQALWRALPGNGFIPLPGAQPLPDALPAGCVFAPRCSMATSECERQAPESRMVRSGRVRCIHSD